jgi:hypothetical protein
MALLIEGHLNNGKSEHFGRAHIRVSFADDRAYGYGTQMRAFTPDKRHRHILMSKKRQALHYAHLQSHHGVVL